jgi:parvulin-like peptidyl-prolyl isomerase
MKLGFLTASAIVITTAFAAPAFAQRICIVDNNNNVVCGRPATQGDLERFNNSQPGRSREDLFRDINRIYQDVLDRRVDREGLRTWAEQLESGRRSLNDIRREIAQSQEARAKINQIYVEVLGRNADPGGMQTWIDNLSKGKSLSDVRNAIANSEEARSRRNRQ